MEKPISSSAVLLVFSMSDSLSTDMPVSWPALLNRSRTSPASFVSTPHAAMADCTESIDEDTSVPFSCANCTNLEDRSSSSSPVAPKRVLTSPTASAAVWKSVGMVSAMFFTLCCMSSRASPEAPVFVVTVSMASSTSFHAVTAPAAAPAIGAVTCVVMPVPMSVIFPPTDSILLPTSSSFFPASCMDAWKGVGSDFTSSVSFLRACSSASICLSSAFADSEDASKPSEFFSCSRASFSFSSFSFVPSIDWARYSCFCRSSSVFDGSSFRSLSTSFNPLPASLRDLFTSLRELSSFVTSPFISIVIPFVRLAIRSASDKLPELRLCGFFGIFDCVVPGLDHHVQDHPVFEQVQFLNAEPHLLASEQVGRRQDFSDCWLEFFFELATCTAPPNQRSTISGRI